MRVSLPLSPWRTAGLVLLVIAAILLPHLPFPGQVGASVLAAALALALLGAHRQPPGEIQAQAARMRSIVETATEGIIAIDEAGVIDTFNGAAERMFGYRAAEVIG